MLAGLLASVVHARSGAPFDARVYLNLLELSPELAKNGTANNEATRKAFRPIHGDALHPSLIILGAIAAVAICSGFD